MLQNFDDASDPTLGPTRVAALRKAMAAQGIDGYVIPRADEYQGEYVPPGSERLRWLTGFAGSAGMAAVLARKACLFVDGRYTVQAREQVDTATFDIHGVQGEKLSDWIVTHAPKGAQIGYDPRLATPAWVESFESKLTAAGLGLRAVDGNLVDAVWADRPAAPVGAVAVHPAAFAGLDAASKLADLQAILTKAGETALVLTMPDSIAWLLNIRGSDIPYTPFALSFAIVLAQGRMEWFIDPRKLDDAARDHVTGIAELREPAQLSARLAALGAAKAKVRLDPQTASQWFLTTLTAAGATIKRHADPCQLAKARKNPAELAGARAAHLRDGVAMCRMLAWLAREAPAGGLDEIAVAQKLEAFRQATGVLKDLSFDTISAAGPHAALPHYRVNNRSNLPLEPNSLFLIDSGGQYQDGTTDITRTIAIGTVAEEARQRFTLVLKGMIAVSLARFPKGTRGIELDTLARRALWAAGLDFDHGTGHGTGSYLSVHEGPQRISKGGLVDLEPGMIISNEPGYYKEGHYGIRIENLVIVTEAAPIPGGDRPMLGFETLTLAPIDRHMILADMLSAEEKRWFDAYHARVLAEIGPQLDGPDRAWLETATAEL